MTLSHELPVEAFPGPQLVDELRPPGEEHLPCHRQSCEQEPRAFDEQGQEQEVQHHVDRADPAAAGRGRPRPSASGGHREEEAPARERGPDQRQREEWSGRGDYGDTGLRSALAGPEARRRRVPSAATS